MGLKLKIRGIQAENNLELVGAGTVELRFGTARSLRA